MILVKKSFIYQELRKMLYLSNLIKLINRYFSSVGTFKAKYTKFSLNKYNDDYFTH